MNITMIGTGYVGLVTGTCFPKDTLALMRIVQEYGVNVRIVEAAVEVNAAQKARMVKKIGMHLAVPRVEKLLPCLA